VLNGETANETKPHPCRSHSVCTASATRQSSFMTLRIFGRVAAAPLIPRWAQEDGFERC
jgi:hypothetical protein